MPDVPSLADVARVTADDFRKGREDTIGLTSARDLASIYLAVGLVRMHSGSTPDSSGRR